MKCGKLTAKLRDAVPVCFIEEGKEIKRVKNIEIPDAIKELEYKESKFDVPMSGGITFKIYFEPGTLPEIWPEPRQRKTRAKKDEIAAPVTADAAQDAPEMPQEAADPHPEEFRQDEVEAADEPTEAASEDDPGEDEETIPEAMEIHYDVPGSARKALASAIGEIIGTYPSYQAAPSFAYIIGEYTLDRNGVLTGPRNSQLMLTLDQDGYRTK